MLLMVLQKLEVDKLQKKIKEERNLEERITKLNITGIHAYTV